MNKKEPAKTVSAALLLGGLPHTSDQLQDAISDQLRLVELTYKPATGMAQGRLLGSFGVCISCAHLRILSGERPRWEFHMRDYGKADDAGGLYARLAHEGLMRRSRRAFRRAWGNGTLTLGWEVA